jgi:hypothetical protein
MPVRRSDHLRRAARSDRRVGCLRDFQDATSDTKMGRRLAGVAVWNADRCHHRHGMYRRGPQARYGVHAFLGSQSPRAAPVGSTIILNLPAPITSISSFMTLAPRDLALLVAVLRSSTCT